LAKCLTDAEKGRLERRPAERLNFSAGNRYRSGVLRPLLRRLTVRLAAAAAALGCVLGAVTLAEAPRPRADEGAAGALEALRELRTTASLLQVTAHPDDEDGGMLTTESRGMGVRVGLCTITRGEGGQNKIGSELFDALGITRTEELLAADRYYGIEQFFTRAVDFGFSKTVEETLDKWDGAATEDLVRAIRIFRPEVLIARFQGTKRDGHAHHQASSIITRRAFLAAGDPSQYPDQIAQGLAPWQPKKLYIDNVRENEDWTVRLDVGTYDPLIGESYSQLGWEGLSHQRTQGVGQVRAEPGSRLVHYKRIDGTPAASPDMKVAPTEEHPSAHPEEGFFDGLDETLPGIAARLGAEESKVPFLAPGLAQLDREVASLIEHFDPLEPSRSAPGVARGLAALENLRERLAASAVSEPGKREALFLLDVKKRQFELALERALGLWLDSVVEPDQPPGSPFPGFRFAVATRTFAVAGESFPASITIVNRGHTAVDITAATIEAPPGSTVDPDGFTLPAHVGPNGRWSGRFTVHVAADAAPTRPYWTRSGPDDPIYRILVPRDATRPFPPFPFHARVRYQIDGGQGEAETRLETRSIDPLRGEERMELLVAPALSVAASPRMAIVRLDEGSGARIPVTVEVVNQSHVESRGTARLRAPEGWTAAPAEQTFDLKAEQDVARLRFTLAPSGTPRARRRTAVAEARSEGRAFSDTVTLIDHPDIGSFPYYESADTAVEALDVHLPKGLKIGYIVGAGDGVPDVLRQLGAEVHEITAEELAGGDLSRYDTIVLGIRCYGVRQDVRDHNDRLLDYVRRGGNLVVQYDRDTRVLDEGNYFPYKVSFPRQNLRVTVEQAPVQILAPDNPVMRWPNKITSRDFDGWVQERGLYFAGEWAKQYTPLLRSNDPGESPLDGGMLYCRYGKGTFVFSAYAWFRQLPEGVPGAIRIFANMVSLPRLPAKR
jgi:LmbE family N-acetylglucosaminyl deacetylase